MSLARKSGGVFLANWTVFPIQFLTGAVVTRSLGAEGKGVVTVLSMTAGLLAMLFHFSAPSAATYFLRRGEHRERILLENYLIIVALVAVAVTGLGFLGHGLFVAVLLQGTIVPPWLFALALASVPFIMINAFGTALLLAAGDARTYGRLTVASSVLTLVSTILLVVGLDWRLPGAILAVTGAQAATALWLVARVARRTRGEAGGVRVRVLGDLLGFGLRLHGGAVSSQMFKRADTYLVAYFLTTQAVGYYSVATMAYEAVLSIPRALAQLLGGEASGRAGAGTNEEAAALVARTARNVLWLMLAAVLVVGLASVWVVPLVYGADFTQAVPPLLILLPAAVLVGYTICLQAYFLAIARPGLNGTFNTLAGAVNLGLSIVLIPRLGIVGNAWATAVASLVIVVLHLESFRRLAPVLLREAVLPRREDVTFLRRHLLSRS
jgi:O-antigen/teichoic acid export membrane protein